MGRSAISTARRCFSATAAIFLALLCLGSPGPAFSQDSTDWITGLPRQPIPVQAWPGGRKVAVCFTLDVEVWGRGQGPNFRSDMAGRDPDIVDESFRQYAIAWGLPRVARLFHDQSLPLTLVLNALFPEQQTDVWKQLRALLPKAPIVAHGMNNSSQLLPLGSGLEAQKAYIRKSVDLIERKTGAQVRGWQSPSVYPNADTFTAVVAEGITFTLDSMDSDILSRLSTGPGPLVLIPYPTITVDMAQYLGRAKEPSEIAQLWIDYIDELAREAEADPSRGATVLAIGIHPFVFGSPAGAAALRRVLEHLKQQKLVWVTDVDAVMAAAGANP